MNLNDLIYLVPAALLAICGHEYAHGYVSWKMGDPTPMQDGRLSMNPLHHLDPLGTLCLIFFHFGWAKPVRINSWYYKDRKKGVLLTCLAGPAANFLMAIIGLFVMGIIYKFTGGFVNGVLLWLYKLMNYFVVLNVGLGIFNLIPVPPLDGSKALGILMFDDENYLQGRVHNNGYIVIAILALTGVLSTVLGAVQNIVISVLWGFVRAILRI
ncbi:site-2 protease family protein [Frisingicoccus sp.]|uniref:site-2 protease family protein n=1 Tax=Frisingicoccus sp. TaxID=1918627 RepID=UPI002EC9C736|nr:site-2 protease family protein [Frisingicoccus sp.]